MESGCCGMSRVCANSCAAAMAHDRRRHAHRPRRGSGRTRSQSSSFLPVQPRRRDRQCLPLPTEALAFAASLVELPTTLSGLVGVFSCFGFLISRLLRFCPLAMAECPFDEDCTVAGLRRPDRCEAVLCRHPLMTFTVVSDTVLRRISPRRERAGDAVDFRRLRECTEVAAQADSLA